jgi:hypothetical protein
MTRRRSRMRLLLASPFLLVGGLLSEVGDAIYGRRWTR